MTQEVIKIDNNSYNAGNIEHLEGLLPVRVRPGMYIGSTDIRGIHHLITEIVDNSVDEKLAGYCNNILVVIHKDNTISVSDDGRGIPVDIHPKAGIPALTLVMTTLHAGGKFGGGGYNTSGGLHGVGASVVNALSTWLKVEVRRNGYLYEQEYRQGIPTGDMTSRALSDDENTEYPRGTKTTWLADDTIFDTISPIYETLVQRFRESCFLSQALNIRLRDERDERETSFYFEGGIKSFVRHLNRTKQVVQPKLFYIQRKQDNVEVEVAFQYTDSYNDSVYPFANNIYNIDGGTHLTGFRTALTRTINSYARKNAFLKEKEENLTGDDVRQGLTAIISVKLADPQFEGQTKSKLGNAHVKNAVETVINDALSNWLEENPNDARRIIEKCLQAARIREAQSKIKDNIIRKGAFDGLALPGKLADCTEKDPARSEIYIVEGDSAGGCFVGETRVALASGLSKSMQELTEDWQQGIKHFGYATNDEGDVRLVPLIEPRLTKRQAELVEVTIDNGTAVRCTPDHLFRLRDGSYRAAAQLKANDSLMPLKTRLTAKDEIVWMNAQSVWSQPQHLLEGQPATLTEEEGHKIKALLLVKQIIESGNVQAAYDKKRSEAAPTALRYDSLIKRYFEGSEEKMLEAATNINCKVVSVKVLTEQADVYDLTVDHYQNFALANGIFVHNSAKQGRDRHFQAILPLRGKILNVERAGLDKMLGNNEIKALVTALGAGIGDSFEASKMRYHRVVIMSVAGDEPTLVRDDTGKIEFVKIGAFIDDCIEGRRITDRYEVMSFDAKTHKVRFRPLKAVIRHNHEEPLHKLTTRYNRSIKVTSSHSVFVYEDGEVRLKKGSEVRTGDKLVASRKLPRTDVTPTQIDLLQVLYEAGLADDLYIKGEGVRKQAQLKAIAKLSRPDLMTQPRVALNSHAWQELAKHRQSQGLKQADVATKLNVKQAVTISEWERGKSHPILANFKSYLQAINWSESLEYELLPAKADHREQLLNTEANMRLIPKAHMNKAFGRYLPISKGLLWFLGWFVAEGTLSKHQVSLNIGKKDEPLIAELQQTIQAVFGETPRCYNDPDSDGIKLYFHSVAAARLLKAWKLTAHAHEKRLPDLVFSLPQDLQLAFLEGYFLGDGTTDGQHISFTTNSSEVKDGLLYLLGQLGLVASTSYYTDLKSNALVTTRHPYSITTISGKAQLEACRAVWQRHANAAKLEAHLSKSTHKALDHTLISDDLMGLEVIAAEQIEPIGDYVYDFSVQDDENFVCGTGGLCAHNTDADVDGSHIRTLLLTFFFRNMRNMIASGYLYIAQPPLYPIKHGKEKHYAYNEAQRDDVIKKMNLSKAPDIQRYKGLGEMNAEQLWETTMNPAARTLLQVNIQDAAAADETFGMLMGEDVPPRKQFIITHSKNVQNLDI